MIPHGLSKEFTGGVGNPQASNSGNISPISTLDVVRRPPGQDARVRIFDVTPVVTEPAGQA